MSALREVHRTVFAFGEGESENVFLKHLRSLYAAGKTQVTVDHAGGKNAAYIIEKATRVRSFNNFDHSFIFLDTIPVWPTNVVELAKRRNFELIGSEPCIEAIFRKILRPQATFNGETANVHKRQFSDSHINGRKLISDVECRRLFLKSRVDSVKDSIAPIGRIIEILEGDF